MGGTIHANSTVGNGSEFTVHLAVSCAEASEGHLSPCAGYSRHVLVVEDNDLSREVMTSMLRQFDCQVTAAASGEDAVALRKTLNDSKTLNVTPHDSSHDDDVPITLLAIVDWRLPGMDGLETAGQLRAQADGHNQRLAVMMLTAFGRPFGHRNQTASSRSFFDQTNPTIDALQRYAERAWQCRP